MGINPGSKYKSLQLSLLSSVSDYSVAENNTSIFPDWSSDWDVRDWYDILVIKAMGQDQEITIKFHKDSETGIVIRDYEVPAIIDNVIFRDVFITNSGSVTAEFDIMYFSPDTVTGDPKRPTDLALAEVAGDVILTFLDNTTNESEFDIERSVTSATTGFSSVGTITFSNYRQMPGIGIERTYTDATVSGSTQYWYRVHSVKGTLTSANCDVETITTA